MSLTAPSPLRDSVQQAQGLAAYLPALSLQAGQLAASLAYGIHGRRRAGAGDQFWQFRPYNSGDSVTQIDWRRTARTEHVILREREWQVAQNVRLWIDRSPSMRFASLAKTASKADNAVVLGLALAQLLVQGGERVGLIGPGRSSSSRDIIHQLCNDMEQHDAAQKFPDQRSELRAGFRLWISDFLVPLADIESLLVRLSAQGERGYLLRIYDIQEESYPFSGHVEFADAVLRPKLKLGRAELSRGDYQRAYAAHFHDLQTLAARFGWQVHSYCTEQSKTLFLMKIYQHLTQDRR